MNQHFEFNKKSPHSHPKFPTPVGGDITTNLINIF